MNITIICNTLAGGKGGAERVATDLAHEMKSRGYDVTLAYEDRGAPAYSIKDEIKLLPFNKPYELAPFLDRSETDLVIIFYFNRRNLVRFVKLLGPDSPPLLVQECTNPDRLRFNNWRLSGLSTARACWEREVVTSLAVRIRLVMPNYALTFSSFQRSQIRAFPNGAKLPDRHAQPGNAIASRFSIIVINGFKPNKNLKDLVASFAILASEFPDWDLRIVGKEPDWDAPHAREIAKLVDRHSLWSRIHIAKPTDDIHAEFAESHIHVIPSLSEGCPTVVLEAMATGVPSIGFGACPGTNELIGHERNGLLAYGENRIQTLTHALKRLMANDNERQQLGEQARCDARNFEPKRIYDQWESMLREAAEYSSDSDGLLREQQAIDYERALHTRRMRNKVLESS